MSAELNAWMDKHSATGWQWFVKYLAGNDTLLTEAHQAGPYIPKGVVFGFFPSLAEPSKENPRVQFHAVIDSHSVEADPTVIWYNNSVRGGTRNECRITGWGGRASPLLDPESTGSLCIIAFYKPGDNDAEFAHIWLCRSISEEDIAIERTGPVEPGRGILYHAGRAQVIPGEIGEAEIDSPCIVRADDVPAGWRVEFPSPSEVFDFAVGRQPTARREEPDKRLLKRRACEFDVFRSLEALLVLPRIREGFATVDLFVDYANAVTNRRKARSGTSLERHTRRIFDEEGLLYSWNEFSEGRKRPDFLFPSAEAYRNPKVPPERLQMLAVKTTCKDRWRQILNEADKLPTKYLLTLQEGVSRHQLQEMRDEGVILVVPAPLHKRYPASHCGWLVTLHQFMTGTRTKCF